MESSVSARSLPLPVLRLSVITSMIEPGKLGHYPVLLLRAMPFVYHALKLQRKFPSDVADVLLQSKCASFK